MSCRCPRNRLSPARRAGRFRGYSRAALRRERIRGDVVHDPELTFVDVAVRAGRLYAVVNPASPSFTSSGNARPVEANAWARLMRACGCATHRAQVVEHGLIGRFARQPDILRLQERTASHT